MTKIYCKLLPPCKMTPMTTFKVGVHLLCTIHTSQLVSTQTRTYITTDCMDTPKRGMCMCISLWQGPNVCYLEGVGPHHSSSGEKTRTAEKTSLRKKSRSAAWRKNPIRSTVEPSDSTSAIYIAGVKVELCGKGTQHNTRHQRAQSLRLTFNPLILPLYLHHVAPCTLGATMSPITSHPAIYTWQELIFCLIHIIQPAEMVCTCTISCSIRVNDLGICLPHVVDLNQWRKIELENVQVLCTIISF